MVVRALLVSAEHARLTTLSIASLGTFFSYTPRAKRWSDRTAAAFDSGFTSDGSTYFCRAAWTPARGNGGLSMIS
jgi:hypothetical protein